MVLLLACAPAPDGLSPETPDIDVRPGGRTASGDVEAIVRPGGELLVRVGGVERMLDTLVDPRLAVSEDLLVYSRESAEGTTDLWRVTLPDGTPTQLTDWPDSEDRPVLSPDGSRLAFVSGRTGFASWWVIDLPATGLATEGRQLTNIGVQRGRPGEPPAGFLPVPDGRTYTWDKDGLSWVVDGRRHRLAVEP